MYDVPEQAELGRLTPTFEKLPSDCRIHDIDFQFTAPVQGRFRGYILIDGDKLHLCDICDLYPPFTDIRRCLEKVCRINSIYRFSTGMVSIDCSGYIVWILIRPQSFDMIERDGRSRCASVSVLNVEYSTDDKGGIALYCETKKVARNLYEALMSALEKYSSAFDDRRCWEAEHHHGMSAARMHMEELRSKNVESLSD